MEYIKFPKWILQGWTLDNFIVNTVQNNAVSSILRNRTFDCLLLAKTRDSLTASELPTRNNKNSLLRSRVM